MSVLISFQLSKAFVVWLYFAQIATPLFSSANDKELTFACPVACAVQVLPLSVDLKILPVLVPNHALFPIAQFTPVQPISLDCGFGILFGSMSVQLSPPSFVKYNSNSPLTGSPTQYPSLELNIWIPLQKLVDELKLAED